MHRRARKLAAVVLVLCGPAVLPSMAAAKAHASASTLLGGVNIVGLSADGSPQAADQDVALAKQLHARLVRTEVDWSILEPRAAGQLDPQALAFLDRLVGDAAAAGIKVIATVRSTPCWDSSAPPAVMAGCTARGTTRANAWPPRDPREYARITAFIARRYGSNLAAIEVWNEPDQANELYFAGPDKAAHYAAILQAAYPAIKQFSPGVSVLAGSLVGSNGEFLRALYHAGINGYYDGLAIHYYNLTLASVRYIRQVQSANGDTKPLWLDEFGWTSCWPHERIEQEQACVTPGIQALNLANTFRSLARAPYVAAAVSYQLRDDRREDFGLVTRVGAHKKASFGAFANALRSPGGRISPVTLRLRLRRGRVVASGSAPVGDYMALEAFKGGVIRYHALFRLDRFNRYSIHLPRVLGTHGLRVRVFQYWAGAARGAQRHI
jgi:polysaccharide biosynthesis protein PslG